MSAGTLVIKHGTTSNVPIPSSDRSYNAWSKAGLAIAVKSDLNNEMYTQAFFSKGDEAFRIVNDKGRLLQ
jgi:hypothetical protein